MGRAGAEKDVLLSGEEGETGVVKGSSESTAETGAGMGVEMGAGMGARTDRDALSSAAIEALVGPASGYLV